MIDSHIHLNDQVYDNDLDLVISRAKEKGVEKVLLISCNFELLKKTYDIVKKDPSYFLMAFGLHPVDISKYSTKDLSEVKTILEKKEIVALGEIGLDYHWYPEEKEKQKFFFEEQIKIAKAVDVPIVVHCREAYDDCYEILKKYSPIKGVVHSYSSDTKMANKLINLGLHIGFTGPITFKSGILQREVAKNISLSKILIETDGPYLTPLPYRGKRNVPENIVYIAREIAFQKNISVEEVQEATKKNTIELFKERND